MITYRIDVSQFTDLLTRLVRDMPKELDDVLVEWISDSTLELKRYAKRLSPVGATGDYAKGWKKTPVYGKPLARFGKTKNSKAYSAVLETGGMWRRPLGGKAIAKVARWFKKKKGLSHKDALKAAFALSRSYHKQGRANMKASRHAERSRGGLRIADKTVKANERGIMTRLNRDLSRMLKAI